MNKSLGNKSIDTNKVYVDPSISDLYVKSALDVINASRIETSSGSIALDLVVIIDTSASMADESVNLSQQIDGAIQNVSAK